MTELKSQLLDALKRQTINEDQLEELEDIIAPACGCGCGDLYLAH
jgi:hypothetical protein